MIRVDRGEEPESLRAARFWRLARAVAARAAGDAVAFDGYDTDDVRRLLYDRQHQKCAYCEMDVQLAGQPVEHFRPKAYAIRAVTGEGPRDTDRYWWLAWTWENLLFACVSCNAPSRKGNRFPLAAGAEPCAIGPGSARRSPIIPRDERAQFVDPAVEDPVDFIQYRREGDDWVPTGRAGDTRGRDTVAGLHLDDREGLLGKYRAHIELIVEPKLEAIRAAVAAADRDAVRLAWRRAEASLVLNPRAPFRGLSYDVLDAAFDDDVCARFDLTLRRPAAASAPRPAVEPDVAHLDGLPEAVVWRVRAIGPAQSRGYVRARNAAVHSLCSHRAHSVAELVEATGRPPAGVEAALAAGVAEGLIVEEAGIYRSP